MKKMLIASIVAVLLIPCFTATASVKPETFVDVYYNNTYLQNNNSISADTGTYKMKYDLVNRGVTEMNIKSSTTPEDNILAKVNIDSFMPTVKVNGVWYRSDKAKHEGRMLVHKAGKNFWQIELRDIQLASDDGKILPLKADQIFYFWNEKFYVKTSWLPTADIPGVEYAELQTYLNKAMFGKYNIGKGDADLPASGTWTDGKVLDQVTIFDKNEKSHGAISYQVINKTGTDSLVVQSGNYVPDSLDSIAIVQRAYDKSKYNGELLNWRGGHELSVYTQVFVDGKGSSEAGLNDTDLELNPLTSQDFQVLQTLPTEGSKYLGYDNTIGAYTMDIYVASGNVFYDAKNLYASAKFQINNKDKSRKVRLCTQLVNNENGMYAPNVTGGTALLCDENMVPNGIYVQTSKKWDNTSGTEWEAFSNSYSVFDMKSYEKKTMWHRTTFQNWGNKINVGLPSLSLVGYGVGGNIWGQLWLQTNIGMSETMCYLPDDPSNATMTDFRAQGGRRLNDEKSPWYQNSGGFEYLTLNYEDKLIYVKRRGPGIRFNYVGPNLMQFDMNLQTPDGKPNVTAKTTTTMLPSNNGSRIFYKVRYDFLNDFNVKDIK